MDWTALTLSLQLAALTILILIPLGIALGRLLAWRAFRGKVMAEALVALPLVLPPTVLGYYLLVAFGHASPLGQIWQAVFGRPLVFTFEALLIASVIFNIPFAVQPMQRGFEAIPPQVRDAAACRPAERFSRWNCRSPGPASSPAPFSASPTRWASSASS